MKYATEDNLRLRYTIVRSVICAWKQLLL
jgi:hypothetical protein